MLFPRLRLVVLAIGTFILAATTIVQAGVILQPASVTSSAGEFNFSFRAENARNQTGLSAAYVSGVTDFDTYTASTTHLSSTGTAWFSQISNALGTFDFDMGGPVAVESMAFWATGSFDSRQAKSFTLLADASPAFTSPITLGTFTNLNQDASFVAVPAQVFTFAPVTARYFRLTDFELYLGSFNPNAAFNSFGEIAFEQSTSAVPEPSTLVLLTLGLMALAGYRQWKLGFSNSRPRLVKAR